MYQKHDDRWWPRLRRSGGQVIDSVDMEGDDEAAAAGIGGV